jgi:hypothetical protein
MNDYGSWLQYASRIGFRLVRIAHNAKIEGLRRCDCLAGGCQQVSHVCVIIDHRRIISALASCCKQPHD